MPGQSSSGLHQLTYRGSLTHCWLPVQEGRPREPQGVGRAGGGW